MVEPVTMLPRDPFGVPGSLERLIEGTLRAMITDRGPLTHRDVKATTRSIVKALQHRQKEKEAKQAEARELADRLRAKMAESTEDA